MSMCTHVCMCIFVTFTKLNIEEPRKVAFMNFVSVVYISNSVWVIVKVCCYWNSVYMAGSLCSLETESLTSERWFGW